MPIRTYLNGEQFDAETIRVLGVAFEITRAALRIEDHNAAAKEVVARKLIQMAKEGERDPDRLSERLLELIAEPTSVSPSSPVLLELPL
jgi:hypothetical protein